MTTFSSPGDKPVSPARPGPSVLHGSGKRGRNSRRNKAITAQQRRFLIRCLAMVRFLGMPEQFTGVWLTGVTEAQGLNTDSLKLVMDFFCKRKQRN